MAPLALLVVGALSFVLYHYVYDLLADAAGTQRPSEPVNVNDVIKTTVTVLTLTGAVLAGIYAYRKQLLAEGDAHRADASQLADRYTTAAEQLGHDQAAVRLAGVYALARLADDWEEQRQVCIDVLCAYLRMPYEPDPSEPGHKTGEREVRRTIVRVIRDHLRTPDTPTSWCACAFDFTGTVFDGGDLSSSTFRGQVGFTGARFSGGDFSSSTFRSPVDFTGARFSGGEVNFSGVTFSGGPVDFTDATFTGGEVNFTCAVFTDNWVSFIGAGFSGGEVNFSGVTFGGGPANYSRATFSGGKVNFHGTTFSGSEVSFRDATFSGSEVSFRDATFSGGDVDFIGATFSAGSVYFGGATLSARMVNFAGATFNGGATFGARPVDFAGATFNGHEVNFGGATFSGGAPVPICEGAVFTCTHVVWGDVPRPFGL
ncbi:pentapeptide repeat-containing protein [Streptomyces canus]|uniref:pentapeptide repeat-containing protein n=1 Tax=Streptomyces canus TaxID=58343 RepID=UPI0030DE1191